MPAPTRGAPALRPRARSSRPFRPAHWRLRSVVHVRVRVTGRRRLNKHAVVGAVSAPYPTSGRARDAPALLRDLDLGVRFYLGSAKSCPQDLRGADGVPKDLLPRAALRAGAADVVQAHSARRRCRRTRRGRGLGGADRRGGLAEGGYKKRCRTARLHGGEAITERHTRSWHANTHPGMAGFTRLSAGLGEHFLPPHLSAAMTLRSAVRTIPQGRTALLRASAAILSFPPPSPGRFSRVFAPPRRAPGERPCRDARDRLKSTSFLALKPPSPPKEASFGRRKLPGGLREVSFARRKLPSRDGSFPASVAPFVLAPRASRLSPALSPWDPATCGSRSRGGSGATSSSPPTLPPSTTPRTSRAARPGRRGARLPCPPASRRAALSGPAPRRPAYRNGVRPYGIQARWRGNQCPIP